MFTIFSTLCVALFVDYFSCDSVKYSCVFICYFKPVIVRLYSSRKYLMIKSNKKFYFLICFLYTINDCLMQIMLSPCLSFFLIIQFCFQLHTLLLLAVMPVIYSFKQNTTEDMHNINYDESIRMHNFSLERKQKMHILY